jgi:diguanylate cyclase (GGDEF)-like protein
LNRTARYRFLPILAALILGGFTCLSLLSYLRARDLMDRQILRSTLPLTSDAIRMRLERILLTPMLASGLMGDNTFIAEKIQGGERDVSQLQDYLSRMQQRTGAITTFLVSDRTLRYYHPSGILKQVSREDPRDSWYYRFRASGKPIEINIDADTAAPDRITAFINVPIRARDGSFLGATGLGLELRSLQSQLQEYQGRTGARILLLDQSGRVQIASDQSRGPVREIPELADAARRILTAPGSTDVLEQRGRHLYVRANRLPEIGWTLVVIQPRTADQRALINLLAQNLMAAVLISLILVTLAQLTLGREHRRLETLARTDMLSGLMNRSLFESIFRQLVAQMEERGEPLALALMDIDHFKAINDNHGHPVGDGVIRHVSHHIQASVRGSDPLFRWGGEEFLLLLPGCDLGEAVTRLEAIRRELLDHPFPLRAEAAGSGPAEAPVASLPVTLSFGVTPVRAGEASKEVLPRADRALYTAKEAGRDRIRVEEA